LKYGSLVLPAGALMKKSDEALSIKTGSVKLDASPISVYKNY